MLLCTLPASYIHFIYLIQYCDKSNEQNAFTYYSFDKKSSFLFHLTPFLFVLKVLNTSTSNFGDRRNLTLLPNIHLHFVLWILHS